MAKRSKIIIIAIAAVLVLGLAGTGITMAKSRIESGNPDASYAAPFSGLSGKAEISGPDNAMRRGGMRGGFRGGMRGGPGIGMRGHDFTRIAEFLGMTTEELRTQITSGKSLAVIATEKGKTANDLVTTILAPFKEHQQVNVKYGYVTQAEADAIYQLRAVRTEAMINRVFPARQLPTRAGPGGGASGIATQ